MAALDEAGVEPEVFLPEYGRDQFEISCGPAFGEAAADRAVAVRGRRQSNDIRRCVGRHALSQAAPYRARARHSANAIERLCL